MDTNKYEQLKTLKKIKGLITNEPEQHDHIWRLCFSGEKYIWYCVKCRKIEEFKKDLLGGD